MWVSDPCRCPSTESLLLFGSCPSIKPLWSKVIYEYITSATVIGLCALFFSLVKLTVRRTARNTIKNSTLISFTCFQERLTLARLKLRKLSRWRSYRPFALAHRSHHDQDASTVRPTMVTKHEPVFVREHMLLKVNDDGHSMS